MTECISFSELKRILGTNRIAFDPDIHKSLKDTDEFHLHYKRTTLVKIAELNEKGIGNYVLCHSSGNSVRFLDGLYSFSRSQKFSFRFEDQALQANPEMDCRYTPNFYLINFKWEPHPMLSISERLRAPGMRPLPLPTLIDAIIGCKKNCCYHASFAEVICVSGLSPAKGTHATIKYKNKNHDFFIAQRASNDRSASLQVPMMKDFDF